MASKQIFVVQAFDLVGKRLALLQTIECRSSEDAIQKAARLAEYRYGVVAFSQMVDPEAQDAEEPVLLASHGRVPGEASAAA